MTYSLDEARRIIAAATCGCGGSKCPARPEIAAVAAQLLATVERVEVLFGLNPDTPCRTTWRDGIECVEVPLVDLQTALGGPDHE